MKKLLVASGVLVGIAIIALAVVLLIKKQQPHEAGAKKTVAAAQNTAKEPGGDTLSTQQSKGMAAIERAAKAGKYLFILFYNNNEEQTLAMQSVFSAAMDKLAGKSMSVSIDINDSHESDVVNKFSVLTAPMPLVLAVAPNGAVTGGFPTKFEAQQLMDAFVSPCMEKSLKALQERKLVFLCIQNSSTKFNSDAMQGVRRFKDDTKYYQFTEIVMLNPGDAAESKLLKQLQVEPTTKDAVTVFLAPPGTIIAKITGETNKFSLETALQNASSSSGCGPSGSSGCGPSGCGPAN
jgi:hypothetical protein